MTPFNVVESNLALLDAADYARAAGQADAGARMARTVRQGVARRDGVPFVDRRELAGQTAITRQRLNAGFGISIESDLGVRRRSAAEAVNAFDLQFLDRIGIAEVGDVALRKTVRIEV